MIKEILFTGVAVTLLSGNAFAAGASKEERTGVGAGVVIGAVAGGPIGAIIGAALGAKVGDEFHERNSSVASLNAALAESDTSVQTLEMSVASLNAEIDALDRVLQQRQTAPEVDALLAAGIEMDLLFRTDEHVLTDNTSDRVHKLATTLAGNSDVLIRLDGYADERGDETYNLSLSKKRAENVRDMLVGAGIPESRIVLAAHGESPISQPDADNFALERRVSMTVYSGSEAGFATGNTAAASDITP